MLNVTDARGGGCVGHHQPRTNNVCASSVVIYVWSFTYIATSKGDIQHTECGGGLPITLVQLVISNLKVNELEVLE